MTVKDSPAPLMITALFSALGDLADPAIRRLVGRVLLLATLLLAGLWGAAWAVLWQTTLFGWTLAETLFDAFGGLAALVLAWLVLPGLLVAIAGLVVDRAAAAVEGRHYPELPPAREASVAEDVRLGLRLAGVALALNLLALPFYLIPPLIPFVYYGVNGYLLAREYSGLVARRRLDASAVRALWKRRRAGLVASGTLLALVSGLPVVNLLTPLLATAYMVHRLEAVRRKDAGGDRHLDSPSGGF